MKRSSGLRRWISGALLAALLFTQFAVAAYACPRVGQGTVLPDLSVTGMPCAEMMAGTVSVDADQPGLCFEHCHADAGHSPLDASQFATLQAPAIVQMVVLARLPAATADAPSWAAHGRQRARAPPEPHSLHHCCWRL